MTLQEIKQSSKEYLVPADLKEVLDIDPYSINVQARDNPDKLGFPVIVTGSRVRIPREAFLFYMEFGRPTVVTNPDVTSLWLAQRRTG